MLALGLVLYLLRPLLIPMIHMSQTSYNTIVQDRKGHDLASMELRRIVWTRQAFPAHQVSVSDKIRLPTASLKIPSFFIFHYYTVLFLLAYLQNR